MGINKNRLPLTRAAIFYAELAAQDANAISVECAMADAGITLLQTPPPKGDYKVGDSMAIATFISVVAKSGQDRLTRLLKIAVKAQSAPVSSTLIKALDILLPLKEAPEIDSKVVYTLLNQGSGRLEIIAKARTPHGRRCFETLADMISDMAKLPQKRMRFKY